MTAATNYLENAVINHFFRNVAVSSPTTHKLALYTSVIEEDGTGDEVIGGGYTREDITFTEPVDGRSNNDTQIEFLNMPACTIVAGAVWTGSNMLSFNLFSATRTVLAGAKFVVPVGEVVVRVR